MSIIEIVAGVERLENKNKELKLQAYKVEDKCKKLIVDLEASQQSVKDWKEKYKLLEYGFRLNNQLEQDLNEKEKKKLRRRFIKKIGGKDRFKVILH